MAPANAWQRHQKGHAGMVFEDWVRICLEELNHNYDDCNDDNEYTPDDDDQTDDGSNAEYIMDDKNVGTNVAHDP